MQAIANGAAWLIPGNQSRREELRMGCMERYQRFVLRFTEVLLDALEALARRVARAPVRTIGWSLLFVLLCSLGWLRFSTITDGDKLWTQQDSISRTQREYVEATYGGDMPFLSIIVTAKSPGDNVLTKLFFDDLWRVDALVKATAGPVDGIDRTFEDVCFRSGNGLCEQTGVLNFWNNSVSTYNATVSTDADLLATVNGTLYSNGQSVTRAAAFGSPVVTDGSLSYARSVSIMYLLANANDGFGDDKLLDYADAFLDEMEVSHDAFTHASVLYLAYNSIDNELGKSIGSDTTLYALCIAILFIVLTLVLGRTCSRLHSRVLLSMGGILSVGLSIVTGFGFCMLLGQPLTPLAQISPFILLGIGLDDMLVLVSSVPSASQSSKESIEDRVVTAVRAGGASITITSLTNVMAFAFGSISGLPSIHFFCVYMCVCILMDYILQITLFLAFIVLDERRIEAGRADLCPNCYVEGYGPGGPNEDNESRLEQQEKQQKTSVSIDTEMVSSGAQSTTVLASGVSKAALVRQPSGVEMAERGLLFEDQHESHIRRFMRLYYAPFLMKPLVRFLVFLLFGSYLAFSIWSATRLDQGLPLQDLAPDGSYLADYIDESELTYDKQIGPQVLFYMRDVDFSLPAQQELIVQERDALVADEWVDTNSPSVYWLSGLLAYAAEQGDISLTPSGYIVQSAFQSALARYLASSSGSYFTSDVIFDASSNVTSARLPIFFVPVSAIDGSEGKALTSVRAVTDTYNENEYDGVEKSFVYNPFFIFWDGDLVLVNELVLNLGLAALGVFVVGLLFLVHPFSALIMVGAVALVDAYLLSVFYLDGMRINSVGVVNLVMSVGISVDFSLHVAHAFHLAPGTRTERVTIALIRMGSPVLLAGATTFFATIPIAFSSSVIFRTFFKLIISTVSFGVLVGLVFIPVVLSLVGPGQLPLDGAVHKRNADGAAESIPMENMSKSTVVPEQQQESSVDASLYRRASLVTGV